MGTQHFNVMLVISIVIMSIGIITYVEQGKMLYKMIDTLSTMIAIDQTES